MKLSYAAYVGKWGADNARFRNNDQFLITSADLREFAQDTADTFGVELQNVPVYLATVAYTVGYLVRYTLTGKHEAFYYALKAGKLPAPTGLESDINWKVVPGPTPAVALSQTHDGLPGGPITLLVDGPQDIQIPASIQILTVWWHALQPEGDYIKVPLLKDCYSLNGNILTLNEHIEGLLAGDTIDLSYSL